MPLKWTDSRHIAEEIYDEHPEVHPLSVRFTDLHKWITDLDDFTDDSEGSSEGILESIQLIWYQEWKEDHPDVEDPYDFSKS